MRSFFCRNLEYVLLILLLAGAAGGVVYYLTTREEVRARVAETPIACRDVAVDGIPEQPIVCRANTADLVIAAEDTNVTIGGSVFRGTSAEAIPASTPSGRRRGRSRVVTSLQVTNTGERPTEVNPDDRSIYLNAAGRVYPEAGDEAQFANPLGPGETARGTLRFELARTATESVERAGIIELGVRATPPGTARPQIAVFRFEASRE